MKSFNRISVTALVLASLALTSCGQNVPSDKDRVPGPESSNSTTVKSPNESELKIPDHMPAPAVAKPVPSATSATDAPLPEPGEEGGITKEESKELTSYMDENPLRIDIDYALKNYGDPKINEVFPKEDFNTKEGIRFGLSLYQDLTNLQDFYEKRDATKDFDIVNAFSDKMTAELMERYRKEIGENGRFTGIPVANSAGTLGATKEGVNLDFSSIPESYWNSPSISTVYDKKYGNVIRILGKRTIAVHVESGEGIEIQQTYMIDVVPSGEKGWLVSDLAWTVESAEVVK